MAKWIIDPDHSVAAFIATHFMITPVRGQFNRVYGEISFDGNDPLSTRLEVEIETASLLTGVPKRDAHLLSSDFLAAAEHPKITFVSRGVEPVRVNGLKLTGDLTIRGVSKLVQVDARFLGPATGPAELGGETAMAFALTGRVNREDFGVTWNRPMANHGVVVSKEILVSLDLEADLQE